MLLKREMVEVAVAMDGTKFYGPNAADECKQYEDPLIEAAYDEINQHVIIVKDNCSTIQRRIIYHVYIRDTAGIELLNKWFTMRNLKLYNHDSIDKSWVGKWFTIEDPDGTNSDYVVPYTDLKNQTEELLTLRNDLCQLMSTINTMDHIAAQPYIDNFINRKK